MLKINEKSISFFKNLIGLSIQQKSFEKIVKEPKLNKICHYT